MKNNECCKKFDPTPWEDKILKWDNKKFVKDKVHTFFYMPMNFGSVITRMMKKIEESGANFQDDLGISDHASKWNMDIYLAVDKEVPGVENTTLSGTFYTKVYEGPFKDTDKWCADYEAKAKEKGFIVKKYYMWYTTCPKCSKKYGKNYTVIVGKVE